MPGMVMRDFIPEGAELTEAEKAAHALVRGGGGRRDFIPASDHALKPPSGREFQADEAINRAMAAQAAAERIEYRAMVDRLKGMNVAQTVDFIQTLPFARMEMALAAEALHGNRKSVLDRFPQVDPEVVARYRHIDLTTDVDGKEIPSHEANPTDADEASDGSAED